MFVEMMASSGGGSGTLKSENTSAFTLTNSSETTRTKVLTLSATGKIKGFLIPLITRASGTVINSGNGAAYWFSDIHGSGNDLHMMTGSGADVSPTNHKIRVTQDSDTQLTIYFYGTYTSYSASFLAGYLLYE